MNLLSNNEIDTRNFTVSPSARVNLLTKNIKLRSGTKFTRQSNVKLDTRSSLPAKIIDSSVVPENAQNEGSIASNNDITLEENLKKFYKVTGKNNAVYVDTQFSEQFEYKIVITDLISGQTLVNETKSSKETSYLYNLSRYNSTYVNVSMIFTNDIVESNKVRL